MLFFPFFILFSSFSSPKHILQATPKVNFKNKIIFCLSSAWFHMEQRLKSILHPLDYQSSITRSYLLSPLLFIFSHLFKSLQPKWPPLWSSKEPSSFVFQGHCTWALPVTFPHAPAWLVFTYSGLTCHFIRDALPDHTSTC